MYCIFPNQAALCLPIHDVNHFSFIHTESAWLMELIGKGAFEKGAVWVATRVPEGAVLAHANQARTSTFSMNDPSNVRFAADVVDFARRIGRFPENAPDAKFDFTNAYDPLTFGGARHGESRVWDVYRQLVGDAAMAPYLEYAKGKNARVRQRRRIVFVRGHHKVSSLCIVFSQIRRHSVCPYTTLTTFLSFTPKAPGSWSSSGRALSKKALCGWLPGYRRVPC